MIELMLKMTLWLVLAMAVGFAIAWLLSKIIYQNRDKDKLEALSAVILERNNMVDKLEKKLSNEKIIFKKVSNDFKRLEQLLAEKKSRLSTLESKLDNSSSNVKENFEMKHKNKLLNSELQKLEEIDKRRLKELLDFEEVLVLSEEKNEEQEKTMQVYRKNMLEVEEELKLYKADKSDAEFVISKDQFLKIEEQLESYQKEILLLKSKNKKVMSLEEQTVKQIQKESDDTSMVKAFRETYKKITKS